MQKSRPRRSLPPALALIATVGAATALAGSPASAITSATQAIKAAGPSPAALNSISCTSATFCMAVGTAYTHMSTRQLTAERWDGARWRRLPVAKPPGVTFGALWAVACPSSTECVAVGWGTKGASPGSPSFPLAEYWAAAKGWTSSQPVPPADAFDSQFNAISCPTTSLCFAAGLATELTGPAPALVERWTAGTWTRETLSTPAGASDPSLEAIACPSAGQCAAVGTYAAADSTQEGLIEQLSGATWTARTAPGSTGGSLDSVSCPTTAACEAVGQTASGTLAERWAGGSWVPTVPPAPKNASTPELDGVSCASATRCVATGEAWLNGGATPIAFIDTRNPPWRVTAQTGRGFGIADLNAVSCWSTATKAPSCAVVGDRSPNPATQRPVSAFLTGTKWNIVPTV